MGDNQTRDKGIVAQESLQPKRIEKDEKAYQSVRDIEERLWKGDATNIALTGPYGSGKSSILITLKEDFPGAQMSMPSYYSEMSFCGVLGHVGGRVEDEMVGNNKVTKTRVKGILACGIVLTVDSSAFNNGLDHET